MIDRIGAMQDFKLYRELSLGGLVRGVPRSSFASGRRSRATRTSALYDMIISYGTEEYIDNKKKLIRYNFFKDELNSGANAIFGLDIPLMRLVHVLKAAAEGYGPEKRVILLHGPVGSSKSTIARLLKQGIEHYSRTADGALYSFDWVEPRRHGPRRHVDRPLPEPDERRAAAPHPAWTGARRRSTSSGSRTTSTRSASTAISIPRAGSSSRT